LRVVGYDCDDWNLSTEPIIEPQFSSEYMQSLSRKAKKNTIMRFFDNLSQKLFKKSG
jgi:transcriptional accessory protein Tex/SPT6